MKRFLPGGLLLILLVLSLTLTACGSAPAIPSYSGSSSTLPVPQALGDSIKNNTKDVKNPTTTAYKTSDDLAKVKSNLQDTYKKAGWDDKSADIGTDVSKQAEDNGGFILGYQKNDTAVAIIGMNNKLATAAGFSGLQGNENVYIVVSGGN